MYILLDLRARFFHSFLIKKVAYLRKNNSKVSEVNVHVAFVGIVAKWFLLASLAEAQNVSFVLCNKLDGFEFGSFVRTVTEGLLF